MDKNQSISIGTQTIVGTMFGTGGQALINIHMSRKEDVGKIIGKDASEVFCTTLTNVMSPYSNNSKTVPSFKNTKEIDKNSRIRKQDIDYTVSEPKIDGFDFRHTPTKSTYFIPAAFDYKPLPTVGDRVMDEVEVNSRNYGYNDDTEIRSIGFKVPTVFVGWGLDTAGRPVPSIYDVDKKNEDPSIPNNQFLDGDGKGATQKLEESTASGDIFALELKKNTYIEKAGVNPSSWVAGPLDVRWDKYRGVWAACPVIVEGYLLEDLKQPSGRATKLKYTSGEMVIYTGHHEEWNAVQPMQKVWVINRCVGLMATSGTYIAAQFFPNGEYRPIWVDCVADPSGAVNTGRIPKEATRTQPAVEYDGGGIVR